MSKIGVILGQESAFYLKNVGVLGTVEPRHKNYLAELIQMIEICNFLQDDFFLK